VTDLMPVLFFGHGNPLNALAQNAYTEGWAAIGRSLPRPRAVLSISAHWYIPDTALTTNAMPRAVPSLSGVPGTWPPL
jgi:4,5-DOPA dioxygenase extradiol